VPRVRSREPRMRYLAAPSVDDRIESDGLAPLGEMRMESKRSRNAYKRVFISAMGLLLIGLVFGALAAPEPARFVQASTDVFLGGEAGYHTYRIPSLIVTEHGTVLAFCEARKDGLHDTGDIDIVLRRSVDSGRTWGPMELVTSEKPRSIPSPKTVAAGGAPSAIGGIQSAWFFAMYAQSSPFVTPGSMIA